MKRSERKKRSFKRGAGIAVIGEGPTEQYYLMSIQGMLPVHVYPKVVKDGMEYLSARVEECIAEGYDIVYCLIDMDNKIWLKRERGLQYLSFPLCRKEISQPSDRRIYRGRCH